MIATPVTTSLLLKAERLAMEVSYLWRLAIDVFKTLKILKSRLHAHIFQERFGLC